MEPTEEQKRKAEIAHAMAHDEARHEVKKAEAAKPEVNGYSSQP